MNGFFDQLLARHLGTCEVVQPRTPGRFEPENSAAATASANTDSATLIHEPTHPSPGALAATTGHISGLTKEGVSVPPPSPIHAKSVFKPAPTAQPEANLAAAPPQYSHSAFTGENHPLPQPHHDGSSAPTPLVQQADDLASHGYRMQAELQTQLKATLARWQARAALRSNQEKDSNQEKNPAAPTPLSAAVPKKPDLAGTEPMTPRPDGILATAEPLLTSAAASPQNPTQLPSPPEQDHPRSGLLETPAWLTALQTQFQQRGADKRRVAEPEPVIHVTIGRVEVRAVQAESAARRQKKPTGVMSLEDYLKQRGGGRA